MIFSVLASCGPSMVEVAGVGDVKVGDPWRGTLRPPAGGLNLHSVSCGPETMEMRRGEVCLADPSRTVIYRDNWHQYNIRYEEDIVVQIEKYNLAAYP